MKKYLLPEGGNFYKANLHSHSNYSDGHFSPEEMKEKFKSKGYSILAYTDHDVFVPHNDLCDEQFIALNAYEIEIGQSNYKCIHMCMIALEPDNFEMVGYDPHYFFPNTKNNEIYKKMKDYDTLPIYDRMYNPLRINHLVKQAKEKGFFVTYNHPCWSSESYTDYSQYTEFDAMEIYNHSSYVCGFPDYNPRVYDDMLRCGRRLYCLATDDCHCHAPEDSVRFDAYGGFVMIKADKLEYRTITKALEDGSFYASMGPEIKALWVEDDYVHVEFGDNIRQVCYGTSGIWSSARFPEKGKESEFHHASFKIEPKHLYFRLTLVDNEGKRANTNAYFLDEIYPDLYKRKQ